jgi:hypothetical protein
MTPEAQCIAIAQACGFATHKNADGLIEWRWPSGVLIGRYPQSQCPSIVPNYTTDLNAMHQAERACIIGKEELEERYWLALYDVCKTTRWPFDATAAQRAEAFLRKLNLWMDDA